MLVPPGRVPVRNRGRPHLQDKMFRLAERSLLHGEGHARVNI